VPRYGHHCQIKYRWFMDYGADVWFKGRSYAYVFRRTSPDSYRSGFGCRIGKGLNTHHLQR